MEYTYASEDAACVVLSCHEAARSDSVAWQQSTGRGGQVARETEARGSRVQFSLSMYPVIPFSHGTEYSRSASSYENS